jgi:hypothetical protein
MQCLFATTEGLGMNNTLVVSETVAFHKREQEAGFVEPKVRNYRESRFLRRRAWNDELAAPEQAGVKRKSSWTKASNTTGDGFNPLAATLRRGWDFGEFNGGSGAALASTATTQHHTYTEDQRENSFPMSPNASL